MLQASNHFTCSRNDECEKEKVMGAILELTSYAATPVGMVAIIAIGAAAYFAARWVLAD
jgi:hypothetical protein